MHLYQGKEYAFLLDILVHNAVTCACTHNPSSNVDIDTKIYKSWVTSLNSKRLLTVKKLKAQILQLVFHAVINPPMIVPTWKIRTDEKWEIFSKIKNLLDKFWKIERKIGWLIIDYITY